ncbi:MAG: RNA polymerase sigma-70 factor [Actinomycetota bacterium]
MQTTEEWRVEDLFAEFRPLMFAIAYRMLGSVTDAEDIVQEAFLRFHRETKAGAKIDSPKAYLSAVTTRLGIDHLRSARVRRESYVGPWLPEPLITDDEPGAEQLAETADSLSMAFLVLLESLSPVERAVFLLREVFEYDYDEIARIVGKSEDNCRQIAVRAKRRIGEGKPRFEVDRRRRDELAQKFWAATLEGDTGSLIDLLAEDVVLYGDGGGLAAGAFKEAIHGKERIGKLIAPLLQGTRKRGWTMRPAEVNGQPGCVWVDTEGDPKLVISLDIAEDKVQTIRSVANPEKLRHIQRAPR